MENKLSTEQLNNISETMLITVWARAVEMKQKKGLLNDVSTSFISTAMKHS